MPGNNYGIGLISIHNIFYLAGQLVNMYFDTFKKIVIKIRWVLLLFFVIMTFFWQFDHHPTFVQHPGKLLSLAYYYATAFMGIATVCSFSFKFIKDNQEQSTKWIRPFSYLGKITLGLYAIHTQLILGFVYQSFEELPRAFAITITFFVTLVISVLVERALNFGKILPQLLLGKFSVN